MRVKTLKSNIFPAACTSEKSPYVAQVCDIWGPHAIMIAWGEEERRARLSPAACGGARLSGFSDDEGARSATAEKGL